MYFARIYLTHPFSYYMLPNAAIPFFFLTRTTADKNPLMKNFMPKCSVGSVLNNSERYFNNCWSTEIYICLKLIFLCPSLHKPKTKWQCNLNSQPNILWKISFTWNKDWHWNIDDDEGLSCGNRIFDFLSIKQYYLASKC